MDVLREREEKDGLERQLLEEQKIRAVLQKRLRRERRARRRIQDKLDLEAKRRAQLEEALKSAGAQEQLNKINEKMAALEKGASKVSSSLGGERMEGRRSPGGSAGGQERIQERVENPAGFREPPPEAKPWGYAGIELMNSGATFWQNYNESLVQELEMERKNRQQQVEKLDKPSVQDRTYYKNSVLFTSTAT